MQCGRYYSHKNFRFLGFPSSSCVNFIQDSQKKIHVLKDSRGLGIQIVARKNKIIVTGISEHGAAYRFDIFTLNMLTFEKDVRMCGKLCNFNSFKFL